MTVKYENLAFLRFVPSDVSFGLSIDLADGYHHLRLHPAIRQYFNFEYNDKFY